MKITIFFIFLGLLIACKPQDAPSTFTDERDSTVYKTVTIGSQTWMAENLKYLPSVVGPQTGSSTVSYYYIYGYDGTSVSAAKNHEEGEINPYETYGVLYNWPAANSACPDGWHLPSEEEWEILENYLVNNGYNYDGSKGGDHDKIAKSLASDSGWDFYNQTGAVGNIDFPEYRNKSGFSALPGGYRFYDYTFKYIGSEGLWWFSTEISGQTARYMDLCSSSVGVGIYTWSKANGFSVRCVKD